MQVLVSTLVIALTLAVSGMAHAEDTWEAKTEADCVKAGGVWIAELSRLPGPRWPTSRGRIAGRIQVSNGIKS